MNEERRLRTLEKNTFHHTDSSLPVHFIESPIPSMLIIKN
jgi:hypothetical protein